jgi:RNA polymerase sigma-70 factor, ECF subfamily
MTEEQLLNKIRNDPAEFASLFQLYYKSIIGYIFRRTGNFEDAADLASETFVKAFLHIRNFDYRGISIKVWLYRIATNEVNMYFRRREKHRSVFDRIDFENKGLFINYLQRDREELEATLNEHAQFLEVLTALKTLPDKYQDAISLHYFEDKDKREIAEIMGVKEGTLKSILSRGLEKLRKKCNHL